MKKLAIISWSLLLIGTVMRITHVPGAALCLIVATLLILIHATIFIIRNRKTQLNAGLMHLALASLTVFLLFRTQYWPGVQWLALIAAGLTIAWVITSITSKSKFQLTHLLVAGYVLFAAFVWQARTHSIYYFINLNETFCGESRETNFHAWDKYSWFLYTSGDQAAALDANANGFKALNEALKNPYDYEAQSYAVILVDHQQKIKSGRWDSWTSWP